MDLAAITDPAHPLKRVHGCGSVAGTFARVAIRAGEPLGLYPGLLVRCAELERWMGGLPLEERKLAWAYDIQAPGPANE